MEVLMSQPFFFKAGPRAVLLLHGFTGNSSDVRMLGRFLEKKGYTTFAPHYKGHGVPPEELIHTRPSDWWEDVLQGYNTLKEAGYEEIAVAGLSLGGVFSLRLGYTLPIKGIATMCAPMSMHTTDLMFEGVLKYARDFKKFIGKKPDEIEQEISELKQQGMPSLSELRELVYQVRNQIDLIYAPIFVAQGLLDDVIDINSAQIIYDQVESNDKAIKWYKESGHVITLDKEKKQLHEDIYAFLEKLDWQE
ncbi:MULTISPECIES: alpha/beta hydrolase [unclassified Viridibacillus]|uniref:alpha/beta hydrolase n=1 Tax=unclassified Viridibacillus TaxID=2617942 RepID=UPI00096D6421|nr:carboxylesterase [Viridibacillus sp. FSL H8-0123]OMC81423.1 carboxylesterase [Viridibacillus sp. FSL H8-0123]